MTAIHRLFVALALVLAACGSKKEKDAPAPAPKAAPEKAAPPSTGVIVLFEAHHLWLGNDTWWSGNPISKTEGFYKPLTAALDSLATAELPGAKAALISYGTGAAVRWQGDLKDLTGDKMGSQKDLSMSPTGGEVSETNPDGHSSVVGLDVASGLQTALDVLTAMKVDHEILIVIGDGGGTKDLDLSALRAAKVQIHAIGIQSLLATAMDFAGDPGGLKKLDPSARWLESVDGLAPAMAAIAAGLAE